MCESHSSTWPMTSSSRTFIIAEAGVNHNGQLELAKALIEVASEAGVDAVKFQSFRADRVISRGAVKARYQTAATGSADSQLEMVRRLELSESQHEDLIALATERGIAFLSTPFDADSLNMLTERFRLRTIKVGSGEITNLPFLVHIARAAKQVILSTGMSSLGEVELALAALAFGFVEPKNAVPSRRAFERSLMSKEGQDHLRERVTLLHCTTEYPARFEEVNLRAMDTLTSAFGLPVGYSDHTPGIHVAIAAVARGARVIEKHFTTDRGLPGPDHRASIEPAELQALVRQIREIESALGQGLKVPTASEVMNRTAARKSIVARRAILKGEVFSEENIACKRPGDGISAAEYYEVLGRRSPSDFNEDDLILR